MSVAKKAVLTIEDIEKAEEYRIDRRLFRLTRGVRWRIALAILLGLGVTASGVAQFSLKGRVIGQVFYGAPLQRLIPALLLIAGLIVLRFWLQYQREIMGQRIAVEIKVRLRSRIYAHLLKLGPGYLERHRTGELLTAAVHGVEQLEFYCRLR